MNAVAQTVPRLGELHVANAGRGWPQGRFLLDEGTFCRGLDGKKAPLADTPGRLHAGDEVIVASENAYAKVIRPPH
jgi:hypothetical protein